MSDSRAGLYRYLSRFASIAVLTVAVAHAPLVAQTVAGDDPPPGLVTINKNKPAVVDPIKPIRMGGIALEPLPSPVAPFAPELPGAVLPIAIVFPSATQPSNPRIELMNSNAVGMPGLSLRLFETGAMPRSFGSYAELMKPDKRGSDAASAVLKAAMATTGPAATGTFLRLDFRADFKQGSSTVRLESRRVFELKDGAWTENKLMRFYYDASKILVREEEYREELPYSAWEYGSSGLMTREERYSTEGGIDETLVYDYRGRYPVRVSAFDATGAIRYGTRLEYTMTGLVSKTEKVFPDGSGERFSYRYGSANVSSSWADGPGDGIRWVYDAGGRLVRTEEWKDGEVKRKTTLQYVSPDNAGLVSRETVDTPSSTRHLELFDDKGRVVQIDDSSSGVLTSRSFQSWDEQDRILGIRTITGDLSETWEYNYEDDSLASERYAKNDVPVRVVSYQGSERIEELYLNGKALLRIYYRDNQRYKEEELRDGLVVRERSFNTGK